MKGRGLRIFPDLEAVSREAARRFAAVAARVIRTRERFTVALSGGSTPVPLFRLLAASPLRERLPWDRTHVFWADERCVPPDDPASNYGLARAHLLSRVPIAAPNVHRMRGEDPPAEAAAAYEADLRAACGLPEGRRLPRLDLVLLGLGEDGHTASLFPGSPVLEERERLVAAPFVERLNAHRLTLTLPVLNAARDLLVLVAGAEKAEALRDSFEPPSGPPSLPFHRIAPRSGRLTWLVDGAAASLLRPARPAPSPA